MVYVCEQYCFRIVVGGSADGEITGLREGLAYMVSGTWFVSSRTWKDWLLGLMGLSTGTAGPRAWVGLAMGVISIVPACMQ